MTQPRLVRLACAITAISGLTAAPATAGTDSLLPPPGDGYSWSDCLYASPAPADSAEVEQFSIASGKAAGTYILDCGGVRHIKDSHGYNADTDNCINRILTKAQKKATSASNDANDLIQRTWVSADGMNAFTGYVVASKSGNHRIVTAYTGGSIGTSSGSGAWAECLQLL